MRGSAVCVVALLTAGATSWSFAGLRSVLEAMPTLNRTSLAAHSSPFWRQVHFMLARGLASRAQLQCALQHSQSQMQEEYDSSA